MKINSLKIIALFASMGMGAAWAQCEADATVYLTDFLFTPNEFTISVGETVAFVNAEGTHNVDGTAEGNPVSFFLEETEGNIDGVCMGTVTFDVPGVYTFTSSIGVQPELGMTGTIIVDAETLCDVMLSFWGSGENQGMDAYASAYAFQSYFGCSFFGQSGGFPGSNVSLEGLDEYTLFLPHGPAIEGLQELMNLNSFDLLYFTEGMVAGLSYHIVPGVYLAEDLQDGALLPTVEGQNIAVSVDGEGTVMLNGATILHEDIEAFNGVIHVIDEVLVPSGYPGATTWDVIVQSPEHTVLEEALLAENLDQALRGQPILNDNEPAEGPFTVFAPTDDAFFALAEANGFESVDALLSSQFIDDILYAHIVPGVYESVDLFNGMNLSSYNNSGTVNITVDDDGIQANTAPVIEADMLAYNGVVHSLGEVMPFEFPAPEGTCGAWTITMTCGNGGPSGWDGASLHVLVDGNEVASETMLNIGSESFFIPVDIGDRIDVVYNEDGWGQYHDYSIADSDGNVVFSSDDWGAPGDDPCSVYGLEPCEDMSSCGLMEVTFFDGDGYGWYAGGMAFYSDEGLESQIFFNPDFDGDGYLRLRRVFLPHCHGECLGRGSGFRGDHACGVRRPVRVSGQKPRWRPGGGRQCLGTTSRERLERGGLRTRNVRHDESGDGKGAASSASQPDCHVVPIAGIPRSRIVGSAVDRPGWQAHFGAVWRRCRAGVCGGFAFRVVPRDCAVWRGRSPGFSLGEGVTQFQASLPLAL